MKNKLISASAFALAILVLASFVSAWGVSSPYWDRGASQPSPLRLYQEETKTITLNIQNTIGDKDVTVKAVIKQGSNISSLEKDTYTVKLGTSEDAILKINAPAVTGTYKVEVEFKEVTSGGTGGIATGISYTISFDVIVSEKPEETKETPKTTATFTIIVILIIIVLAAAVYLFLKKRIKK